MLLEIYEKGILTCKPVAHYFHTITAFSFMISQGSKIGNKKRAVDEFWMIWYSNTGDEHGNAKQKAKQANRV